MGTDQQAWLLIVLWGQLLLLATIALSWLRNEWGRWQTWAIAVPVLSYIMLPLSDEITRVLAVSPQWGPRPDSRFPGRATVPDRAPRERAN
jgi:hypothetical protein